MVGKLALLFLLFRLLVSPAQAQPSIDVAINKAALDYPKEIQFKLSAHSPSPIDTVYLLYGTDVRSCSTQAGRQGIEITPGGFQSIEWVWDLINHSEIIPPGASVWWQWEIHNQAGESLLTEKQTLAIEDPDYEWKTLQRGNLSVDWIKGDNQFGKFLIDTAERSLERLARKAGVRPEKKIRLIIYPDGETFHKSVPNLPDWAGGVAFAEYGSVVIIIPAGSTTWGSQVIPHELAHLVTDEQTYNCMGVSKPTWLAEGLSVFAEGPQSHRDVNRLKQAIQEGKAPSLRSLSAGFIGDDTLAALNYILSGYAVNYMIETYGAEKLGALLAELRSGQTIDRGLQQVYGFDTDGLDREWRLALGYPPPTAEAGTVAAALASTAIPTLALWTPPVAPPTATSAPSPTLAPTPIPTSSSTPHPSAGSATGALPSQTAAPVAPARAPLTSGRCLTGAGGIFLLAALTGYWSYQRRRR